ncbi:response regulator [Aureimonas leprariae]|nr:response regulator [Aureimonas leprariae]
MIDTAERCLSGKRILVVEDDWFLAMAMAQQLEDAGATVVGPAPDLEEAMETVRTERIDGALLDVGLDEMRSFPVADVLKARRVPFVFASAFGRRAFPNAYADVPNLGKPFDVRDAAKALFG